MSIFNHVKSKLSILDVVLEYVQVKRMGGYWKGACPFHSENDASFTVSPDRQIFYCFGCHMGGDVISFIAKIENLSQMEAVRHAVEKYKIDIPEEAKKDFSHASANSSKKEQFFHSCSTVALWAQQELLASSEARSYLEERGISSKELERFGIGYFPGGSRSLNKLLREVGKNNVLLKDLSEAGIVAQGRSNLYSPFEERILFPIKDGLGRNCGFGGRVFRPNDDRAKYYNSKESDWFSKGKLLFGLDLAKKDMQSAEKAFLVEGYTDCVAMSKAGHKNTIATLGTACTAEHLKILSRYVKKLFVLYDGDAAGQKAILRLTKLCWEANLDLQIIKLPAKEDPASFIGRGGSIDSLVESSTDIFTFFVSSLGNQFWGKSLSERVELCEKIIELIAKIGDKFKQDLLLQQATNVMQVPFDSLKQLLARHVGKSVVEKEIKVVGDEGCSPCIGSAIERQIISFVINSAISKKPLRVDSDLIPYFSDRLRSILERVDVFTKSAEVRTFDSLLDCFSDTNEKDWIIEQSFLVDDGSESFDRILFQFRKNHWKSIVRDMKERIFWAKQKNDSEKLVALLGSFSHLKQEMKERGLI